MESRVRRSRITVSLATLFTTTLTAQATLTVGPGGYPQIADAVAAAQPGDLVVVQPGTYLPFDLSIGVRILAPDGATVMTPVGVGAVLDLQPAAGQQATLVGLTFQNNPTYPPAEPAVTVHARGNLVFADCTFRNTADYGGLSTVCDGDLQFDRCSWTGYWDCMSVVGGRMVANSCTMHPSRTQWAAWDPTCIAATSGDIRLNFCELKGSDATINSYIGSPAIRLSGSARLAIADSTVLGGASATWASTAIENTSIHPVWHARSRIEGGSGLLVMWPPVSGPGPAFAGAAQAENLIGGLAMPTGPRIGASYGGAVLAPTDSLVVIALSFERTSGVVVPFAAAPVHFDPAAASIFAWGVANQYTPLPDVEVFTWQTVTLPPGLFGGQFWLHTLAWDGATFQVGPTFGGLVRP